MYLATVAMTVAAWQAFIEDLALAIFDDTAAASNAANTPLLRLSRRLYADQLTTFNTPNSDNTRSLFAAAGFELGKGWAVNVNGPPQQTFTASQANTVLDRWVQVRHCVAHGFPLEENAKLKNQPKSGKLRVITGKAPAGKGKSGMAVNRKDAHACVHFFKALGETMAVQARVYVKSL